MEIHAGHVFDTSYEKDCIAVSEPDELGNFDGYDSDNVLCTFNICMVTRVGEQVCDT